MDGRRLAFTDSKLVAAVVRENKRVVPLSPTLPMPGRKTSAPAI